MKGNWNIRRTTVAHADAAHRWDQAYLHLLRLAPPKETTKEEVPDARGDLRPGIHPRVSTPRQGRDRTSDQQVARLERYAERQGWVLDGRRLYLDEGYSGASLNRPGLDALRDAVAMAEFEVLLVAAPDRLARKYVHQVLLLEELQGRGCRVEFLERPMSQDPNDQLLLAICVQTI